MWMYINTMSRALDWKDSTTMSLGLTPQTLEKNIVVVPGLNISMEIFIPQLNRYMAMDGEQKRIKLTLSHPFAKLDHKQMYRNTGVVDMTKTTASFQQTPIRVEEDEGLWSQSVIEATIDGAGDLIHKESDVKCAGEVLIAVAELSHDFLWDDKIVTADAYSYERIEHPIRIKFNLQKTSEYRPVNAALEAKMRANPFKWSLGSQYWGQRSRVFDETTKGLLTEEQNKLPQLPGGKSFPFSQTPITALNTPAEVEMVLREYVKSDPYAYAHSFLLSLVHLNGCVTEMTVKRQKQLMKNPVELTQLFLKCIENVTAIGRAYNFDKTMSPSLSVKIDKNNQVQLKPGVGMSDAGESHNYLGRTIQDDARCHEIRQALFSKIVACTSGEISAPSLARADESTSQSMEHFRQTISEELMVLDDDLNIGDCEDGAYAFFRRSVGAEMICQTPKLAADIFAKARGMQSKNDMKEPIAVSDHPASVRTMSGNEKYGNLDGLEKYIPILREGFKGTVFAVGTGTAAASHPEAGAGSNMDMKTVNGCAPFQSYCAEIDRLKTGKCGGHAFGVTFESPKVFTTDLGGEVVGLPEILLKKELTSVTAKKKVNMETLKQLTQEGKLTVTINGQQKSVVVPQHVYQNVYLGEVVKTLQKNGDDFMQPCPVMWEYEKGLNSNALEDGFVRSFFSLAGGPVYGCTTNEFENFERDMKLAKDLQSQKNTVSRLLQASSRLSTLVPNHVNGNWKLFVWREKGAHLGLNLCNEDDRVYNHKNVMRQLIKLRCCRVKPGELKWKEQMNAPALFNNLNRKHTGSWDDSRYSSVVMASMFYDNPELEYGRRSQIAASVKGQWRDLGARWVLMVPVK